MMNNNTPVEKVQFLWDSKRHPHFRDVDYYWRGFASAHPAPSSSKTQPTLHHVLQTDRDAAEALILLQYVCGSWK
jgi:hypothetical protein